MTDADMPAPSGGRRDPGIENPPRRILRTLLSGWNGLQRLSDKIPSDTAIYIGLSALIFLIVYPKLFPLPSDINAHDEAEYIQSGYRMYRGELPPLAYHPLVSVLFTGAYALLHTSPWWFIQSEWLVGAGLFLALWICVWDFGRALRTQLPVWAVPVLWLLIPTPNRLLDNPSQMLFTILLTCALSESIRFLRSGRPFHLLAVSAFLGSAFLARGEGLWVLLLAFPGIAVLHASSLRKNSRITAGRMLAFVAAYFLPFVLIASLYMVLFWSSAHSLDTGLATRSYQALEAGQALSYPERYQGNLHIAGIPDSRAIYGTAAENQSSVVNAFFRNPAALIQRVVRNVWAGPQSAAQALGGLAGILVALFAAGGAVRLLKDRQGILPVLFLFFSLFLLLYLPFFWLTDYFLFLFPALFFLAAKGIVSVVEGKASWLLAALGLLAAAFLTAGIFAGSMRFFFFGLVLLMVWLVGITALRGAGRPEYWLAAVGAAFLLMSNPTYATRPDILPDLQADPMAQTAVWLWGNTQPTDTVAGWGATAEYLAGRPFLSLEGYLDSPATLYAWLIDHRVAYLYQNDAVKDVFPAVYESADSLVAQGCLEPFPDAVWGTARILRIQSKCGTGE